MKPLRQTYNRALLRHGSDCFARTTDHGRAIRDDDAIEVDARRESVIAATEAPERSPLVILVTRDIRPRLLPSIDTTVCRQASSSVPRPLRSRPRRRRIR